MSTDRAHGDDANGGGRHGESTGGCRGDDPKGVTSMDTYLTVAGNLTADPTQHSTANGASVVHLRVASSGRRFDKASGEFRDGDPLFITVSCWRSLAMNVMATLRKGDSVIAQGRLIYRSYEDRQGNRRSVHELDAIAVGPDLSRWPVDVRRPAKPADGELSPASTSSADMNSGSAGTAADEQQTVAA
jgi:single-strand DNA-binding protein